ncbi:hypothetical protein JXX18_18910 [Ruthenibacterium lactatiformans]|uniref:hypothetical protein n=1 Tax=Ruthenibacterium lactatiformans TaxID=1550024 RepID=UPI0019680BC8|nr:hypothetical protein [Ruthenibacterium lactatiformans]MBN3017860.1 hypothetical protein [Ruthenibacterium lactatiformans]MDU5532736.1 hypothetical protein [Oscillospiraceae bacterium]
MTLGVVVVLYCPTEENQQGISRYLPLFRKAVLVDNSPSPTDHSRFPGAEYVFMGGNRGIGAALNRGAHLLLEQGVDGFVTMDQDSVLSEEVLKAYKKVPDGLGADIRPGCLAPQYLTPRHEAHPEPGTRQLLWTMQSGVLFFRKAFQTAGDFREDYFIDGVDYEYCLRLKKFGYAVLQCNEAVLVHEPATTCELKLGGKVLLRYGIASPERYYYQIRNMIAVALEYRSLRAFLVAVVKFGKIVVLFPDKKKYLARAAQGIRDGFRGRLGSI